MTAAHLMLFGLLDVGAPIVPAIVTWPTSVAVQDTRTHVAVTSTLTRVAVRDTRTILTVHPED